MTRFTLRRWHVLASGAVLAGWLVAARHVHRLVELGL